KASIGPRVEAALRLVRLDGLAERLPRQLSGGQQQRVALARALVIEPDVLLLDEPLSNLDAKLRQEVRVEIRELQRKLGLTTVMVTHDQEEALTMADRLVVMANGQVQQVGDQRALYERPANQFVAGFVGRSNFVGGRVQAPGLFRSASGLDLRCPPEAPTGGRVLTLRPERLALAAAPVAGAENCLAGTVEFVSYLGGVMEYHVRLTPQDRLLVQAANQIGGAGFSVGDRVHLHWPATAGLVLADEAAAASQGEASIVNSRTRETNS
ncbi:MAG: ABC transporter ATP-binding protein, partial [Alphaproteobacteria bacterium]|nr:ABC transporter ATP-binding protein [Alphaproteobacteria bacterium]